MKIWQLYAQKKVHRDNQFYDEDRLRILANSSCSRLQFCWCGRNGLKGWHSWFLESRLPIHNRLCVLSCAHGQLTWNLVAVRGSWRAFADCQQGVTGFRGKCTMDFPWPCFLDENFHKDERVQLSDLSDSQLKSFHSHVYDVYVFLACWTPIDPWIGPEYYGYDWREWFRGHQGTKGRLLMQSIVHFQQF